MSIHDEKLFTAPIEAYVEEHVTQPSDDNYVPNPLFENLVPATPQTRAMNGKLSFAQAMPKLGISSVFDIIRQPKKAFAGQVRTLSDADGEMAYDNALCYATQIARSYREESVSSGRDLPLIAPQAGVRALVDIGPSYPNLFKENWDQFCKVGAIEAMDGPVAYLRSLRRFAAHEIEGASTSPKRIPLVVRRPDLDKLVIDEQSTYQSRPMLDLVNDVLTQGIDRYQTEKGDVRPVQQLLTEKKHPFVFPYHFAHQQVSLALSGEKPRLGEINHTLAMPGSQQPVDQSNALSLMSGLSPAQQRLLVQPSPFAALSLTLGDGTWESPVQSNIYLWGTSETHFEVPEQAAVSSVSHQTDHTLIAMTVQQDGVAQTVNLRVSSARVGHWGSWFLPQTHRDNANGVTLRIAYDPTDNDGRPLEGQFHGALLINVMVNTNGWTRIGRRLSLDICTGGIDTHGRTLTAEETLFFREHYGIAQMSFGQSALSQVNTFCQATGVDAEQLQSLIAQKQAFPRLSPNCPIVNPTGADRPERRMPSAMNYGAVYVNGTGGQDAYESGDHAEYYNNGLTFRQQTGTSSSLLGNTCLDRFDRMQRMIRLQRWMDIPFAELDTLIVSAMRAEGNANPGLQTNQNTLRILGAYRYFNRRLGIGAEEFAAFVHDITPFASGDTRPLFDRVFNNPVLFGAPLVLDQTSFTQTTTDMASQKTIGQLCAGLGLLPDDTSFGVVAANIIAHVGPLKRSLPVVSALYRQARIAALFSLSVADLDYVLRLLGGEAFVRKCTAGVLLPRVDGATAEADMLDILMELDQAVRWLAQHKINVTQLRELLTAPTPLAPTDTLLEQLQSITSELRTSLAAPERVAALKLPRAASGAAIDWHARMVGKLINDKHEVLAPTLTLEDTAWAQLTDKVADMAGTLGLADEDIAPTVQTLADFLYSLYRHEQQSTESFLQAFTGLLPERALMVERWSGNMPLATRLRMTWLADNSQNDESLEALLRELHAVQLGANACTWIDIGARALRTFVVHPAWLGGEAMRPLTWLNVRLFKAYSTLFNSLGQPEERLLGYLDLANTVVSKRPGKRQLAAQAQTCNVALAALLGWSESEVALLTARLPQHFAKTVAHIDWVRRAQVLAMETGLSAATLLQACALKADSPDADWQAVGQAVMAAAGTQSA